MNEIFEIAQKCGAYLAETGQLITDDLDVEAFAKLIISDARDAFAEQEMNNIFQAIKIEREACAKVCEDNAYRSGILAQAIRERGAV